MTFTNTIKVDVGHPWKTAQVYVKQGDKDSRKIRAELMNGAASWTIPVGTVATFRAKKPDDTVVTQDATIGSPNIVEVVLDEQVGAVFGVVRGEIRLVNGGEILNTFLIAINVEAAAVTDGDIVSRDVLDEYQALVDQMLAVAGSPLVANAAADMTDKTRVYVYTGSEVGYVNGDWYFWDGAAWTAGGAYNSQGIGDAFIEETAQYIKQSSIATESDSTPYLYRPTPNPSAILADEEIVGGTVAHNQLIQIPTTSLSKTENNVTITDNRDGTYTVSTTSAGASAATYVSYNPGPTVINGHKYLYVGCPSGGSNATYRSYVANNNYIPAFSDVGQGKVVAAVGTGVVSVIPVYVSSGTVITTPLTFRSQFFDLTAKFGSSIADYLYTLESGTPGAGVAKLREWGFLSKVYSPYNAGSLVSVNTSGKRVTGRNLFDKSASTRGVYLDTTTGQEVPAASYAVSDYIPVQKGRVICVPKTNTVRRWIYDTNKNPVTYLSTSSAQTYTPTIDGYLRFSYGIAGVNPDDEDALQVEYDYVTNYQPYRSTTYHTTPTDLNGIFKLDSNNNLYADGDVYEADGTVTRRYALVDLGSLSWTYVSTYLTMVSDPINDRKMLSPVICVPYVFTDKWISTDDWTAMDKVINSTGASDTRIRIKDTAYTNANTFQTAMNGVYCLCELDPAYYTTETATPYTATQIVGKGGTEEWVDERSVPVPVGHRTTYSIGVPDVPSNASAATLKATVSSGKTTLSWS